VRCPHALCGALWQAQGCIDLKVGRWSAAATAAGARSREMRFVQKVVSKLSPVRRTRVIELQA
jgi:hypothetical protein